MLLALCCGAGVLQAAEVRGRVLLEAAPEPVSVALLPLEDQRLPASKPRLHVVRLHNRDFLPAYLTAAVGDRIQFINDDPVFHFLTAPYGPQPVHVQLANRGENASATLTLSRPGTLRVFCHLHQGHYVQIDVLQTPLAQMTDTDGNFQFENIPPGRWRLRVAALGGRPVYRDLTAFTSPPPVVVRLAARPIPPVPTAAVDPIEALFPGGPVQP